MPVGVLLDEWGEVSRRAGGQTAFVLRGFVLGEGFRIMEGEWVPGLLVLVMMSRWR